MMNPDAIDVTLAGIRLRAPIAGDREATLAAVDRVNDRIKEIEGQSDRIDTQAFALLAALAYAAELDLAQQTAQRRIEELQQSFQDQLREIEQDDRQETTEILSALHRIVETLHALARSFDE